MSNLNSSMRLKVKGDTFFLPNSSNGVYLRNNLCSFRMEGRTIYQWIEKCIPMFNGEHTLEDLTDELPDQYRDRVYEIAAVLLQKGFVRDVSQDRSHELPAEVYHKYVSQIEFLDNIGDSGAYRFQSFRQAKVLAVGSGPFFVSLVAALLESGLPKFHMLITESSPTNRERLLELEKHAYKTDPEVALEEIPLMKMTSWQETAKTFDSILYVAEDDNIEEMRVLHAVCREEQKLFLPAICHHQMGMAGPLVKPDSKGCWESARRRLYQSALNKDSSPHYFSPTGIALLANVLVFELFKTITGVTESEQLNKFFLLDLETLEGNWHSFIPHPLVAGDVSAQWVEDYDSLLEQGSNNKEPNRLLPYFSQLTSKESGIFHTYEEGDLKQLPLAQCRIKVADPLSAGPAGLLPDIVCTGLTHEETRRETGLAGIEAYVSRMIGLYISTLPSNQTVEPKEFVGVGAGETIAEGICRGLEKCLAKKLEKHKKPPFSQVHSIEIEDKRCLFYLQSLTTMHGTPVIALGEEVVGFPVVWVGSNGHWYGNVGFNVTSALRSALQQALAKAQNQEEVEVVPTKPSLKVSSVFSEEKVSKNIVALANEETAPAEILQSALQILKQNHRQLLVLDLALEPFLKEELAGVFGVLLREEESQ